MEFISKPETEELQFVIAGYSNRMRYHEYNSDQDRLLPGQPLTVDSIKELFKFVNNIEKQASYRFRGMIPNNIISYQTDEKNVIWYTAPQTRELYYKEGGLIESGNYPLPGLVWILQNTGVTIYACQRKPKDINDKLYQAPFFNVNSRGSVCMGSAKFVANSTYYEDIIKEVELGFFNSRFTHSSTDKLIKGNFVEFTQGALSTVSFDTSLLVDSNLKIKDILKDGK